MSYELKYVKYKLKYLKLLLNSKFEQKGGVLEIIEWPKDFNKIKKGDILEINDYGTYNNLNKMNYPILMTHPVGEVFDVNKESILLLYLKPTTKGEDGQEVEPLAEHRFYASYYPKGIFFKKINVEKEKNDPTEGPKVNPNLNPTVGPSVNPNILTNSNDKDIERIKEQIRELEVKQKQLENKLNNHYHIMPTSGMKEFEEAHPYYNRKID